MLSVTQAKYIKNYQLEITFNDNQKGIIDLQNTIENDPRPIFQELKDQKKFSQIKIDMDTVVWKNGLDLAPEFLYNLLNSSKH